MATQISNKQQTPTLPTQIAPATKRKKPPGLLKTVFGYGRAIPEYGELYFDHLQGEFLLLGKIKPEDEAIRRTIEGKKQNAELMWNDIYTYQMILVRYQDFETLKSSIISLRNKYQNLTNAAEYGDYLTLRSVDVTKITDTEENRKSLRADYQFLIKEFYLRYSYLTSREKLRSKLIRNGAILTLGAFIFLALFIVLTLTTANFEKFNAFSTLITVIFAGIMGAFVSMQQRFQNVSHGGDPIYNLSLLTHGWLSIFISPISGAIFAALLFLFFAGGLLKGTIFPEMIIEPVDYPLGKLANFFVTTQPATGKDFALLIVWSFIAGFAERFVPDTLMRLVNQKKPGDSAET